MTINRAMKLYLFILIVFEMGFKATVRFLFPPMNSIFSFLFSIWQLLLTFLISVDVHLYSLSFVAICITHLPTFICFYRGFSLFTLQTVQ